MRVSFGVAAAFLSIRASHNGVHRSALFSTRTSEQGNIVADKWQKAANQLLPETISPHAPTYKFDALIGDKLLGASAAQSLLRENITSVGNATRILGLALSNSFLAAHVADILPTNYVDAALYMSDHEVGTMVEVAVAAVHAANNTAAVDDLANSLVQQACRSLGQGDFDLKGKLINLGGSVEKATRIGGSDHVPVFSAVATMNDNSALGEGSSKKIAEQQAAFKLLDALGNSAYMEPHRDILTYDEPERHPSWEKISFHNSNLKVKQEETLTDWWARGANLSHSAFRRAMLSPMVFPDTIIAVDSWKRVMDAKTNKDGDDNPSNQTVALLTVITHRKHSKNGDEEAPTKPYEFLSLPIVCSSSASKVQAIAGKEVTQTISKLVARYGPQT